MNAIIKPAGSSPGVKRVRPARSENATRIPPINTAYAKRILRLPFTSLLVICGTISPTNPNNPANETTAAQSALESMIANILSLKTFMPKLVAASSPRQSRLSFGAINIEIAKQIISINIGSTSCLSVTPVNPPTENAKYDESISGNLSDKKDMPALSMDDTATPASIIVDFVSYLPPR